MISRRQFMQIGLGAGVSVLWPQGLNAAENDILRKSIPSSGEQIPVIGMGTWRTFNVGSDPILRSKRKDVLKTFFELGGGMVDSSPMYGSSEEVVGWCYEELSRPSGLFSATKVWTRGQREGVREMEKSRKLWQLDEFDLMQVHNLLDWETHLDTLKQMKADNKVRYIGLTTSHGRYHSELERIMARHDLDFVQLTYNILDREAENRLLPLARERGIAVIANRPFQRDDLFHYVGNAPLPKWAKEFDAKNWAQFFLKFIVSHAAVTCAIPATTQIEHMQENMGAARGRLPEDAMRKKMIEYVETL